jgi:predicted metal-dependent enzyme (double-stranded beta helix superfamily)
MKAAPGLHEITPIATAFLVPDCAGQPGRDAGAGRTLSPAELSRLVRATARQGGAWRPIVRFTPDQRWFHRLALTADYEIWLLTWLPGQRTGFHDHGNAAGAFAVAQGELRETLAAPGSRRIRRRTAVTGSVTSFGGRHLHDVGNVAADPAVSVHAYSPPLSAMRRYEMTRAGLALVRTERAELDW